MICTRSLSFSWPIYSAKRRGRNVCSTSSSFSRVLAEIRRSTMGVHAPFRTNLLYYSTILRECIGGFWRSKGVVGKRESWGRPPNPAEGEDPHPPTPSPAGEGE